MYQNILWKALAKPDILAVSLGFGQATAIASGQSKISVPGIFGNSGEKCRCSDFTVRRKNGLYEGKWLSKFKVSLNVAWC